MRMLDRFVSDPALRINGPTALARMKAVAGMQRAVFRLDDARIVVRASVLAWGIKFQVALPFPGAAFVLRNLHCQTVTTPFGVIADQRPVAVAQRNDFRTGAGIRQIAVRHWDPCLATVT